MLKWTGERFIPGEGGAIIRYEHVHRYSALSNFVRNKRVIDVGCGEGYGSAILSSTAVEVVGVDVDSDAVAHANEVYNAHSRLNYQHISAGKLPFDDAAFDLAVCFEVIEHLEAPHLLLPELARIVGEDGVLVISTPNKRLYSDERNFQNEFHLHEFYIEDFRQFLMSEFKNVRFFGQRILSTSFIWEYDEPISQRMFEVVEELHPTPCTAKTSYDIEPLYIVAMCSQAELDALPQSFLVTEDQELTLDIDGSVPAKVVKELLARAEDERIYAQKILKEYEFELKARARALQDADGEVQYLRKRVKDLEDGAIGGHQPQG